MQRQRMILESVIIVAILKLLSHRLENCMRYQGDTLLAILFIAYTRDLNCFSSVKSKKVDHILDFCRRKMFF